MTAMTFSPAPPTTAELAAGAKSLAPRRAARAACACLLGLALAGCAIGPDYRRPEVETPAAFRHAEGWKAEADVVEAYLDELGVPADSPLRRSLAPLRETA